ncbi:unnamed protein product [Malus baccata var. baccata]
MDVPRFSGPVFLTGGGSPSMQGEGNSSCDNSTSSFPNVERSTEYAAKASLEGRVHSENVAELLVAEDLTEALLDIEFPLVNILTDMELWGVGLDMEGYLQARKVLGKKLRQLEKEAYKLAGMKFSDEHPIIPVIKEHRTLAKLLNCTLVSICSLGRLCEDTELVHITWSLAPNINSNWSPLMEEPNRQCVEHIVDFKIYKDGNGNETDVDQLNINARDFFIPTQGRKRFLSKIKLGNSKEKSKAQRSCEFYMSVRYDFFPPFCGDEECGCLKVITEVPDSSSHPATKLHVLKGRCRILLQVHDELVLEVDPVVINEAALLLQTSMENAVSLRVPLHVKLTVGRSWGSLQPFQGDQYKDKAVVPEP